MDILNLFDLKSKIQILDIGAAAISETPIYKVLIDKKLAHLSAFDGDERHIKKLKNIYGKNNITIFNHFLFDGKKHNVYFCDSLSGMTSILKPNVEALKFFNGFKKFGKVDKIENIQTIKLDDVQGINLIDFLKMDIQGAELMVMKHGSKVLSKCIAIQLELSFFNLYENQPSIGEMDTYLRSRGFVPHRFIDVKKWSISPTIFNNNFRLPGNQLLECDMVYVKNPLNLNLLSDNQIKKMLALSHYSFQSIDFCVYLLIELERRNICELGLHKKYIENISNI